MSVEIPVRCEALPAWTYGGPEPRRSQFDSYWTTTLDDLRREAAHLKAREIVLAGGWTPAQLRRDGWPRADARPAHPGVVVYLLGTTQGDLPYPIRTFTHWQDNVRAVALALESLRRVGRYGVARHGEQYRGFRQLEAGAGSAAVRGRALIIEHGGVRQALLATHPDRGGDPEDFAAVQAARPEASPDAG